MRMIFLLIASVFFVHGSTSAKTEFDNLKGTVVNQQGEIVVGAEVILYNEGEYGNRTEPEKDSILSTKTDADGKFTFERWPADDKEWFVFAYKKGLAIHGVHVRGMQLERQGIAGGQQNIVKIVLAIPAVQTIDFSTPGNQPLTRVQAALDDVRIGKPRTQNEVSPFTTTAFEHFDLKPSIDGNKVRVDFLPKQARASVIVTSTELGRQTRYFDFAEPGRNIGLREVGTLRCRVVNDKGVGIPGQKAHIHSRSSDRSIARVSGLAYVESDQDGWFEVEKIATGRAQINLKLDYDRPLRLLNTPIPTVSANQTTEYIIELKRGIKTVGKVVDDKGNGLAGIKVNVNQHSVVTNEKGEFTTYSVPGTLRMYAQSDSTDWIGPRQSYAKVPADLKAEDTFEIPPIKLKRSKPLSGQIVDESGRPVPFASVSASWVDRSQGAWSAESATTKSDGDGNFVLPRVRGDLKLQIYGRADALDLASVNFIVLQPDKPRVIQLKISKKGRIKYSGNVVDQEGNPVADAMISMWQQWPVFGTNYSRSPVRFPEGRTFRTNAKGEFETPTRLARVGAVNFTVVKDGFVSNTTEFVASADDEKICVVEPIELEKATTVTGIVVGSKGQPIADAKVWSYSTEGVKRQETRTDAKGRFRLGPIRNDSWFVFVGKIGMRTTGTALGTDWSNIRFTLFAQDETDRHPPLKWAVRSGMEEESRLRDFLKVQANREIKDSQFKKSLICLKKLVDTDADFVREKLKQIDDPSVRSELLFSLGNYDEAIQVALSIEGFPKVRALQKGVDYAEKPEQSLQILEAIAGTLGSIERPAYQLHAAAWLAEALYDLGKVDAGKSIIDKYLEQAKGFQVSEFDGHSRGKFAETVGLFYPDRAIELVKPLDAFYRHGSNLAQELATNHPEQAEKLLTMIFARENRMYSDLERVLYRMAANDLERAVKLAKFYEDKGLSKSNTAAAIGAIAFQIRDKKADRAKRLIRQAFDTLEQEQRYNKFETALVLLRYSMEIDPTSTNEYFWRSLALHDGPGYHFHDERTIEAGRHASRCQVAVLLAMFDRYPETQKRIVEPAREFLRNVKDPRKARTIHFESVPAALTLFDSAVGIQSALDFDQSLPSDQRRYLHNLHWIIVAELLKRRGHERYNWVLEHAFNQWVIGKEDW